MPSVISHLAEQIRGTAAHNANTQSAPAAILWTDKERQWQPVLHLLQEALPELFALGVYAPEKRTGPAIWLKCIIANQIESHAIPEGVVPIIYMPGVSRAELRAIEHCADEIKPLAELQYRGVLWGQYNGKDWTANAYLTSSTGGLGLELAKDRGTQEAMLTALDAVLTSEVQSLEHKRLEANDFNQLLSNDPIRDLLSWMNSPQEIPKQWNASRWQAFCSLAKANFDLNIESDGEYAAAEKLCSQMGPWQQVWQRFVDSPLLYPTIPTLLERVPLPDLLADPVAYPQANAQDEEKLLSALTTITQKAPGPAREKLIALDKAHGARRRSLWARLGMAPWAILLEPLADLAQRSQNALGGLSPQELGDRYAELGWLVDAAAIRALAQCDNRQQTELVEGILATIYTPWLAELNERFQTKVSVNGYPGNGTVAEAIAQYQAGGEIVFFVDGLRLDVAHQLQELLAKEGVTAELSTQWSALPSVTATAKPAVSPIHQYLDGSSNVNNFEPNVKNEGTLSHDRFKRLLAKHDWQYLADDEIGDPSGNAWVACGDIDKEGHRSELKLPRRLAPILKGIVERSIELQQGGWRKIRIVTDHGWLLVPGKMPKSDLPAQAADSRWGRCAKLKQNVAVEGLTLGWHWNGTVPIYFPHGIHSFIAGRAYGHGGVSLQECLVPILTIEEETKRDAKAAITSIRWIGLTCKVEVNSKAIELFADLRTKLADKATSLVNTKKLADGKANLKVLDDDNEGFSAMVVVLDSDGKVLAKQTTTVGGDD